MYRSFHDAIIRSAVLAAAVAVAATAISLFVTRCAVVRNRQIIIKLSAMSSDPLTHYRHNAAGDSAHEISRACIKFPKQCRCRANVWFTERTKFTFQETSLYSPPTICARLYRSVNTLSYLKTSSLTYFAYEKTL